MILVWVDHDGGEPDALSLEALTFGRRLAASLDVPLNAVVIGTEPMADRLRTFGVVTINTVWDDRLSEFAPAGWAQSVVDVMEAATSPQAVLAAGSDRGNEVMAHVAAKTALPLAANCVEVEPGDVYLVTRLRWGGSLLEEARLSGEVKLLTVAPHALPPEEDPGADPIVQSVAPTLSDEDLRVRIVGREAPEGDRISLGDARVVVGGGRGVGSAEGFRSLDELAALLGGAVGVSRAVTSLGWRPHAEQIGQTGMRIAPDLYIACGISGAIQHIVGCKAAKKILAINTDPEAPILAHADYAVIGDLHKVVPAVTEEIRRLQRG
jgi:electron transfer flavoprotein alpha subunit